MIWRGNFDIKYKLPFQHDFQKVCKDRPITLIISIESCKEVTQLVST